MTNMHINLYMLIYRTKTNEVNEIKTQVIIYKHKIK